MRAAVLFFLVLALTPGAVSSGAYRSHDEVGEFYGLGVTFGTPVSGAGTAYRLDLFPGDRVTASIAWTDPALDLDLSLAEPTPGCTVLPVPDAACLAKRPPVVGGGIGCPGARSQEVRLGPATEALSFVASRRGDHRLDVIASVRSPLGDASYAIEIQVVGAGTIVGGPEETTYLMRGAECRTP